MADDKDDVVMTGDKVLGKRDAALIIRADGSVEMLLPDMPDDEDVPENVVTVAALGAAAASWPDLTGPIIERFKEGMS